MKSSTPEAPTGLPVVRVNCPIAGVGVAYTTRSLATGLGSESRPQADAVQREGRDREVRNSEASQPPFDAFNLGLHVGDDAAAVQANRLHLAKALGTQPFWLHQVHGTQVFQIDRAHQGSREGSGQEGAEDPPHSLDERSLGPQADASVCSRPGQACAILTADCLPVLLASASGQVVGAAHAGWRGAVGGVLDATVDAMVRLGARLSSIRAAVGPCIGKDSYEVGPEFPAPFIAENPANRDFFRPAPRAGHFLFDLTGYVGRRLERLGLGAVERLERDTCAEADSFFSYRRSCLKREADFGRGLSAITLAN